jgi:flagellin
LLSRLQELAVLGANQTNTAEDASAIDMEAEAIGDEFHRLLNNAKYKGADLFKSSANGLYVSLGGRNANMTFGVKLPDYTGLYDTTDDTVTTGFFKAGRIYTSGNTTDYSSVGGNTTSGTTFTASASNTSAISSSSVTEKGGHLIKAPSDGADSTTNDLTSLIETVQNNLNTARVQAGSQYAALESAVNYITDLTAQYELGYNTVNDVNFSMETAHLAKNQILQQAATAMLAQANTGQQSLLQLIQG